MKEQIEKILPTKERLGITTTYDQHFIGNHIKKNAENEKKKAAYNKGFASGGLTYKLQLFVPA